MEKITPELLEKYAHGQSTPEELDRIVRWLEEGEGAPTDDLLLQEHSSMQEQKIWDHLNKNLVPARKQTASIIQMPLYRIAAACVIFVALLGGIVLLRQQHQPGIAARQIAYKLISTGPGQRMQIVLPDSSVVNMNENSTLKYMEDFANGRSVDLIKGEAFFSIQKDPQHPFSVYLDSSTVKVLGTKFNIKHKNSAAIAITLTEGKIGFDNGNSALRLLSPGEQLTYVSATRKILLVEKTDVASVLAWTEGKLIFTNTPLEEVCRQLAEKYQVSFEINQKSLLTIPLTATFREEPLEKILHMIEMTGNVHFYRNGNTIQVTL